MAIRTERFFIVSLLMTLVHSKRGLVQLFLHSQSVTSGPGHHIEILARCVRVDGFSIKSNFEQVTVAVDSSFSVDTSKENGGFYICNNGTADISIIHLKIKDVNISSENPKVILYEMLVNDSTTKDIRTFLKTLCTKTGTHETCELWIIEETEALPNIGDYLTPMEARNSKTNESSCTVWKIATCITILIALIFCSIPVYQHLKKPCCPLTNKAPPATASDDSQSEDEGTEMSELKDPL